MNVEGVDQTFQSDLGIPVIGNRPAPVPIKTSYGDPNDPADHFSKVHLGTEFNHKLNNDWAIHNRFLMTQLHLDSIFLTPTPAFGGALSANNQILNRNIYYQGYDDETYTTNMDLTGKFQLLSMKHETLVGFDFLHTFTTSSQGGNYQKSNPALAINVYDPSTSYGIPTSVFDSSVATFYKPAKAFGSSMDNWYGAYFQDQITIWDKLHILGGGRYDWVETGVASGPSSSIAVSNMSQKIRNDEHFSPRMGVLYQPWNFIGVFGSWSNSFGANNGITSSGASIAPETGEQYEAGFKTQFFEKRLTTNLAYFYLTKNNVLTTNYNDPTSQIPIGEVRSRGIEFDMTGKITSDLSVIGNFAYTDARVTKDNDGFVGARLINVPDYSGSTWLKYDFNTFQKLKGLSVGIGGVAVGSREGNLLNPNGYGASFQLPGYVRMDAMAAYAFYIKKTRVTTQFNIKNLLDKTYYDSADAGMNTAPRNGVYPGAPLMAFGSIKVEF
ncbi:MAG: TonB-dependent receptor [Methylococcales bacterium]